NCAESRSEGNCRQQNQSGRPVCRRKQPGGYAADRELRADGNIDLARDDDQRRAARDNKRRCLPCQERQEGGELIERRREHPKCAQDYAQRDTDGVFAAESSHHAAASRPKARPITSWASLPRGRVATKVPLRITPMRSANARTSGKSLEISMIATPPLSASSRIIRCSSLLVPISTPCVGSSRISNLGWLASQRANATFC